MKQKKVPSKSKVTAPTQGVIVPPKAGLLEIIYLSLCAALFVIGVSLSMKLGLETGYPVFMFSTGFFFLYKMQRDKRVKGSK